MSFQYHKKNIFHADEYLRIHPCGFFRVDDNSAVCSQQRVRDVLVTYGVKEAFTLVKYLYDVDPTSRASCHTLTHYIGSQAYRLSQKHTPFTLSPEIAYCSYGFYHGFAEELFRRGGNVSSAAEFCAYVDRELTKYTRDSTLQCYFGMGHGVVNNHDYICIAKTCWRRSVLASFCNTDVS